MSRLHLVTLAAHETHGVRRRVLYGHWPEADVHYPEDDLEGAFHLGMVDGDGGLVAVASWYPQAAPTDPDRRAYRLRGMAVDGAVQGTGVGRALFDAGLAEARRRGADLLWANSRDSALGFYRKVGMEAVGERFFAAGGLPHHVVVCDLGPERPPQSGVTGPAGERGEETGGGGHGTLGS